MKKKLIINIFVVFFGGILLCLVNSKYLTYPIHIKHLGAKHPIQYKWLYDNLRDSKTAEIDPIFWETPINWRMTKYDIVKLNLPSSHIIFNGNHIDVSNIQYLYDTDYYGSELKTIKLKIPYQKHIEDSLLAYYGIRYIHAEYPNQHKESARYFYTWVLDHSYVTLERMCCDDKNDYIFIEIGEYNYPYIQSLGYGAYYDTSKQQRKYGYGEYADSIVNLSFQNIKLGEHINNTLENIENNHFVFNIHKVDSATYYATTFAVEPEEEYSIYFDTELRFYKDTLAHIIFSTDNDHAKSFTDLFMAKYKFENGQGSSSTGEWDYSGGAKHRQEYKHREWCFQNQAIHITQKVKLYEYGRRDLEILTIEYIQSRLYEEMMDEQNFKYYERKIEEQLIQRQIEINDSIKLERRKAEAKELI